MPRHTHIIVTTTIGTEAEATALAESIVRARLASCVQTHPIHSTYWWKGKMESGNEIMLACKTRAALAAPLQDHIKAHHPYELPEIVILPITGGLPGYLAWIERETESPSLTFAPPAARKGVSRKSRS